MDIQGGVQTSKVHQNPAILGTGHIKQIPASKVDRCRVVRQVREEAENPNVGILCANRGGIRAKDYEVTMLIAVD